MENKKLLKFAGAVICSFGIFTGMAWSFFVMMLGSDHKKIKSKEKKTYKKKWFQLSHFKINHPRYRFEKEYEEGKEWCRSQKMQDHYLYSMDGLRLHAYYLPAANAVRSVILCHGYRGSGFGDFANIARFLHENNCNLLFIDERGCGESEGDYITFGAKEQYDVRDWAFYLSEMNHGKLPLYLYGESMGASTVLMASGHTLPKEVRGIIADCGFRTMRGEIKELARNWFHIKWINLLLLRVDICCRLFAGFRIKDADTMAALKKNKRPILFFHGELDTFVQAHNTYENYAQCCAPKEMIVIPGARHLCSCYVAPKIYRKKLLAFLEKNDINIPE